MAISCIEQAGFGTGLLEQAYRKGFDSIQLKIG
jgi:hypothetical protein